MVAHAASQGPELLGLHVSVLLLQRLQQPTQQGQDELM
jgi:hypothetical protein